MPNALSLKHMRMTFLAGLILLACAVPFASAQTDDTDTPGEPPLLQALRLLPDSDLVRIEDSRGWYLSYVNFRAVEAAQPAPVRPVDFAQVEAWSDNDNPALNLWLHAIMRVRFEADSLSAGLLRDGALYPDVSGLDYFEIDQAMFAGWPPATGLLLLGDFDHASVTAAYTGRSFTEETRDGLPLLCPPDGCDSGTAVDLAAGSSGDIFDFSGLGQRVPILRVPGGYFGSPSLDFVEQTAAASATGSTLYAADDIYTLALALTDPERYAQPVIQVLFFSPENFQRTAPRTGTIDMGRGNVEVPGYFSDYGDLPGYDLVALADMDDGEQQIAVLALLYDDETAAQTAAAELENRIRLFTDFFSTRSEAFRFIEMIDNPTAVDVTHHVFSVDETGLSVALLEIRYPRANFVTSASNSQQPGLIYGLFFNSWLRASLDILWTIED